MGAKKITDHITCFRFKKLHTVHVWAVSLNDGGYVLIDTGFNNSDVESALKDVGFAVAPKAIVITHCHLDHTGCVAKLAEKWGVQVIASVKEASLIDGSRRIADEAKGSIQKGFLRITDKLNMMTGAPVRVERQVSEGDTVEDLRVVDIPGHTPGQIALVHEGDGAVISADAFVNYKGRIRQDPMRGIDLDREEARRSLAKLSELGYDNILPSHGKPLLGDGRQRLREFLEG